MFNFFTRARRSTPNRGPSAAPARRPLFEGLEGRTLMSAAPIVTLVDTTTTGDAVDATATKPARATKVAFSETPAAVQEGLTALAQGTEIAATHVVKVKTLRDGTVTYNTSVAVNGKKSKLSVDADGNPLAGKVAYADVPSTVQTALQAQVSAVELSADQVVSIKKRGDVVVYLTSTKVAGKTVRLASDADGTAVTKKGRELEGGTTVTFGEAPAAVQAGLTALAQGTTISDDQEVDVLTLPDASTVYAALLSINGEAERVAVAADGTLLEGTIAAADAPAAVRDGLQTVAGDAATIADGQWVQIHTRPGGTSTYATTVELNDDAATVAVGEDGAEVAVNPWGGRGHGGPRWHGGPGGPGAPDGEHDHDGPPPIPMPPVDGGTTDDGSTTAGTGDGSTGDGTTVDGGDTGTIPPIDDGKPHGEPPLPPPPPIDGVPPDGGTPDDGTSDDGATGGDPGTEPTDPPPPPPGGTDGPPPGGPGRDGPRPGGPGPRPDGPPPTDGSPDDDGTTDSGSGDAAAALGGTSSWFGGSLGGVNVAPTKVA